MIFVLLDEAEFDDDSSEEEEEADEEVETPAEGAEPDAFGKYF